jgi:hypothetical protein
MGIAQMFMAVFSVILLVETGLTRFTFVSAAFTTLLTMTSIDQLGKTRASRPSSPSCNPYLPQSGSKYVGACTVHIRAVGLL